jgi:hypothetical protein
MISEVFLGREKVSLFKYSVGSENASDNRALLSDFTWRNR